MSKQFAKILTICALAIIIPIAIVGTAILLSNSVKYTVNTSVEGVVENIGEVSIKINGKATSSLAVSRNSIVKLTIETTGYSFNGWYEAEEVQAKVDAEDQLIRNYEFKINHDVNFKAVVERLAFNVSYDGDEAVSVKYGEKLKKAESTGAGTADYQWYVGWQIDGAGDAYTHATFSETAETINLTAVREAGYESITFAFNISASKLVGEDMEDVRLEDLQDQAGDPIAASNSVVLEEATLRNREANFKTAALEDLFTIFDKDGNKYEVSNIVVRYVGGSATIARDSETVNALTIQDVLDKYNAIEIDDIKSGGTITLSLSYFMITE